MKKPILIGVESYKKIVDKNYYYVDKTLFIKEILDGGAQAILLTRPRRFGKTLALSMLQTFFEDECESSGDKIDNSAYFIGKKFLTARNTA